MLHLKELIQNVPQGAALDVGTRLGEFIPTLRELMPEGSDIVGLDCDAEIVAQARAKFPEEDITFQTGNALELEFCDGAFTLVAISNTLHHIEAYDAVLDEMLRVLKPGGYFVVNEMFSDGQNPAQQVHFAQHTLEAKLDVLTGSYQRPTWTKGELMDILGRLPLEAVQTAELLEEPEMDKKLAVKTASLRATVIKQAAGRPECDGLAREAEAIQRQYEKDGIQRCTQLVYIGKKPI